MNYLASPTLLALMAKSLKYVHKDRPSARLVKEGPQTPPLISVIISTYNRSSVLRLAIRSVLWQTEQDFEILVMGDGCSDDSEEMVRSFGDARLLWHNLPSNSGHQSAPNNEGLRRARGQYIAYLGHDDVWHPEHLGTLLRFIRKKDAGFATSLVEMIGPEGSNYREIAGLYPRSGYDGKQGIPPSGLMHRADVVQRIGGWNDYRAVWRNPEVDFEYRAFEAGLKFVSTHELTVFKFNSTLRKNSYRDKPCHEQTAYCKRIENDRFFLLKESCEIARVHWRRLPVEIVSIPPPATQTPGWNVEQYRKLRGLE
jgi:glycosyltransferase involved in cell wall biosynthesis